MRYRERRIRRRTERIYRSNIWTIFMGSLFVIFGILILFDNLEMISFRMVWRIYWPLLLILIGLIIVLRRYSYSHYVSEETEAEPGQSGQDEPIKTDENESVQEKRSEGEFSQSNVFGNIRYSSASKEYPGGNISNIFGDIFVDLSDIDFSGGTKNLSISGVFGSLKVKLPKNIGIRFSGSTIAGTVKFIDEKKDGLLINLNSQSADYNSLDKKLNIQASLIFGDMSLE
jgi:predicted membrane protein